jgi:hypothetical protein
LFKNPFGKNGEKMEDDLSLLVVLIVLVVVALLYCLPTFIAFGKHHPNRWIILALNMFLGGTGIVWFGCLIWALHKVHDPKKIVSASSGGESGLNIFANDVKTVRILPPNNKTKQSSTTSKDEHQKVLTQIERLFELKQKGILTDEEFQSQKAKLLSS